MDGALTSPGRASQLFSKLGATCGATSSGQFVPSVTAPTTLPLGLMMASTVVTATFVSMIALRRRTDPKLEVIKTSDPTIVALTTPCVSRSEKR